MRKCIKNQAKSAVHNNYWRSVLVFVILVGLNLIIYYMMNSGLSCLSLLAVLTEEVVEEDLVTVLLLAGIFLGISLVIAAIGFLIKVFLINPLEVGCKKFCTAGLYEEVQNFSELGMGFKSNYKNIVKVLAVRDVFVALWGILSFVLYMALSMGLLCAFISFSDNFEDTDSGIIVLWATVMVFIITIFCVLAYTIMYVKVIPYMCIPYILGENPDMPGKQVFALSKQMMKGETWNMIVLFLSFLGWHLLSGCTYYILYIFYVGPYMNATMAAYYKALQQKRGLND